VKGYVHCGLWILRLLLFLSGLSFLHNRACYQRLVWWSQRSWLCRYEAWTWWCMLCSLSCISLVQQKEFVRIIGKRTSSYSDSTVNGSYPLWIASLTVILLQSSYCLFSVRIMSPVPRVLSRMKLTLMKNWVICGLLLYWRHSTCLGMLFIVN